MNTSPAPIRLEPLPTAFAPPEDPVCVATPSCCCCCCCLASVSATTTYAAAEAYYSAVENEGSPRLATTLAVLGGVCTLVLVYGAIGAVGAEGWVHFIIGGLGALVFNVLALVAARYERRDAWKIVFAPAAAAPLGVAEAYLGYITWPEYFALSFLIAPVIGWLIVVAARDGHRARSDTGPTAVGSDAGSDGS